MKITFLGTRGGIKKRSQIHFKHSSISIASKDQTFLIDCGTDWLNNKNLNSYDAIFITHAHKDHSGGLSSNITVPVYTTLEIAKKITNPPKRYEFIEINKPIDLNSLTFTAFSVLHSKHTPTVGYKISSNNKTIFYVPDLVAIEKQQDALEDVDLYIGDGAIISRTLLIRKNDTLWGHAPITHQLEGCKQANIKKTIFTHCGTEIVSHDAQFIQSKIDELKLIYQIDITIAYDGLSIIL